MSSKSPEAMDKNKARAGPEGPEGVRPPSQCLTPGRVIGVKKGNISSGTSSAGPTSSKASRGEKEEKEGELMELPRMIFHSARSEE